MDFNCNNCFKSLIFQRDVCSFINFQVNKIKRDV